MIATMRNVVRLLGPFAEPEVELGRADQTRRQAAKGVGERRPLRHRRQRHHARAARRRARRPRSPAMIQPWWTTSGWAQVAAIASDHARHAGVHALPRGGRARSSSAARR